MEIGVDREPEQKGLAVSPVSSSCRARAMKDATETATALCLG